MAFFLKIFNVIVDYCRGLRTNITNDRMLELKTNQRKSNGKFLFFIHLVFVMNR